MSEITHDSSLALQTRAIKQAARELGFDMVGVVRAETLAEASDHLREWLHRGYQAEMSYLARNPEVRTDPRKIFPAAKSVVVVALNYYTPHQHSDQSGSGKVSRYAWGDDYHDVVSGKLRELLNWTKQQWPDADGKVCVDIQSTMDKAWAVRAGLGWMGKHTNLITPEFGSWVFIGELLLNLEFAYDQEQIADQCGSCTLCIDACPTNAIAEPYLVDANLCISHATIESRAPQIRDDVASRLEGWLYGCDICQDVCPWNHSAREISAEHFQPREGNVNASLSEILELTPEAYAERFRRSSMKRAKLSGLQRNAHALLDNAHSQRSNGLV